MKDYYQLLHLEKSATQEEIKKAFKLFASKFHPDKHKGDKFFEKQFIEVKKAYDTLSDPNRKSIYDRSMNQNNSDKSASNKSEDYSKKEADLRNKEESLRNKEATLNQKERAFKEARWKETEQHNKSIKALEDRVYLKYGNVLLTGKTIKIGFGSANIRDIEKAELIVQTKKELNILGYTLLIIGFFTLFIFIGVFFLFLGTYLIFKSKTYYVNIVFKHDIDQVIEAESKAFALKMLKQINKAIFDSSKLTAPT